MTLRLPEQIELTVGLEDPEDEMSLRNEVARRFRTSASALPPLRLLKRSLDARRGRIQFHLLLSAEPPDEVRLGGAEPREARGARRVVVVGDGPAGLFCAYELARRGVGVVVVDRGKAVQPRRRDLKLLNARGGVDPDSNYCFGEGGAGTYSDGKLYTRSHKRGNVRDVLEILALHGAPSAILTEARPHIGSNLLPEVIDAMRRRLEAVGVEFRFGSKLTHIETAGSGDERRVTAVRLESVSDAASGSGDVSDRVTASTSVDIEADAVVLATGHSARDVFELLERMGARLEAKSFALGVRIEHPQSLINRIQFGAHAKHPKLGAASYKVVEQIDGRGVFSFCMCPGGWIVPAMTDAEHLVVNGMSLSKRDSDYANSGLVVAVDVEDYAALGLTGPLAGVEVQRRAERAAALAGGGNNRAPAARAADFAAGRVSSSVPDSSYLPGLVATDVAAVLDATGLPLAARMRKALSVFDKQLRGYSTNDAVLVGVESRTSAPVRVVRDDETLEAPGIAGLYPAGEGAGYAGGIVSAAVDGLRIAERVAARVGQLESTTSNA